MYNFHFLLERMTRCYDKLYPTKLHAFYLQVRLSVEVPPVVCEDSYRRVIREFAKQSRVL